MPLEGDTSMYSRMGEVIILTKADKLTKEEIEKMKDSTSKNISKHPAAYPEIIVTSSLKSDGIPMLRAYLASLS